MTNLTARQMSLLTFLSIPVKDRGVVPLDPVRIQKGMFIFAKETPTSLWPAAERYDFRPYQYGPCSFDIYSDLDFLVENGLAVANQAPGKSWAYYQPTTMALPYANAYLQQMNKGLSDFLVAIKGFVVGADFDNLLRAVYAKYPEFAVNSVFKQ